MVIDSFRALRAYAGEEEFRRFLHDLAGRASAFPASHFWVGEYTADDMIVGARVRGGRLGDRAGAPSATATARRGRIEVLKLRGSGFLSGRHAYRLGADGIDVFPRLADLDGDEYAATTERASSGIPALDALHHRRLPQRVEHPRCRARRGPGRR